MVGQADARLAPFPTPFISLTFAECESTANVVHFVKTSIMELLSEVCDSH